MVSLAPRTATLVTSAVALTLATAPVDAQPRPATSPRPATRPAARPAPRPAAPTRAATPAANTTPATSTTPASPSPTAAAPEPPPPMPAAEPAPPSAAPAPVVAPVAAPEAPPQSLIAPPPPPDDPLRARPAVLVVQAGFRLFGRNQWYTDDFFQRLRPYTLTLAPAFAAAVEWYPAQSFTSGPASWFGVVASAEYGFGFASADAQGRTYGTTAYNVTAGLRARRTFWRAELGLTVAWGHQVFEIDRGTAAQAPPEGLPNVTYDSVRVGLSGRLRLHRRAALLLRGTWLAVIASGELDSDAYFPRATAQGVEVGLGVAVPLVAGVEVRAEGEWRRYVHDMHVVPGDRLIAGGAVDDYYAATLSVAYRR